MLAKEYMPAVLENAERWNVPFPLALALIMAESGGRVDARSPKGALGLGQLMPATAKQLGVDPTDPVQNIAGSMQYLGQQKAKYGTWPLALAAYNAGPGNVDKYGGVPPFRETQNYVAKLSPYAEQGEPPAMPQMEAPMAPGAREMPQQKQDFLGGLLSDPAFLMGASILGTGNVGRGIMSGAAASEAMSYRRTQQEALRAKLEEDQLKRQQQERFLQLVAPRLLGAGGGAGGMGAGGAAGGMGGDIAGLGALGALLGIEGAGKLVDYGNARLPYGAMTQAQQAEEQQRQWQRQMEAAKLRDEGVLPAGGTQGGMPGTQGMAPKDVRAIQRETPLKTMDYLMAERKSGKVSGAMSTLQAVNAAKQALDAGMFTGPFAETKAGLAKYLGAYTGDLQNTEQYIAATAELARQALQQIGGNDSNTDLLFSRATTGGDITMQAKSLQKLMDITDSKSRSYLQDYNRFAQRLPEAERGAFQVEIPQSYQTRPRELPKEVTLGDVQETAKALGKSEADVIKIFRSKGVGIRY